MKKVVLMILIGLFIGCSQSTPETKVNKDVQYVDEEGCVFLKTRPNYKICPKTVR